MHVCGGQVQNVAFIQKAAPCAMKVMLPCQGIQTEIKSNGCCEDRSLAYKGKDFSAKVENLSPELGHALWISDLPYVISVAPLTTIAAHSNFILYKPPLLSHDISVRVHSFQI